jgi:hypothetical protein
MVDLEAGDRVFVDTGDYTNTAVTTIGRNQSGVSNSPVLCDGKYQLVVSVGICMRGALGLELKHVSGIENDTFSFFGAADGLSARNGRDIGIRNVTISGATRRWDCNDRHAVCHGFACAADQW